MSLRSRRKREAEKRREDASTELAPLHHRQSDGPDDPPHLFGVGGGLQEGGNLLQICQNCTDSKSEIEIDQISRLGFWIVQKRDLL